MTGFDPDGCPANAWLLHAMYQNQALASSGTHQDLRRFAIDRDAVEPVIIGEVDHRPQVSSDAIRSNLT